MQIHADSVRREFIELVRASLMPADEANKALERLGIPGLKRTMRLTVNVPIEVEVEVIEPNADPHEIVADLDVNVSFGTAEFTPVHEEIVQAVDPQYAGSLSYVEGTLHEV